jgi:thioesterase domain-containing protein
MATDYIKEIQTLQPQGPYFLVGECIGGVVAYEAARQLEAMGQKVAVLALMDTKVLTTSEYLRLRMDKFLERKSTSWEENPIWARIIFHSKQLRQLDSRQRVHYVFDKARRAVPAVLVEILPKILPRQQANMNGSNGKRQLSAHLERARTAYLRSLRRYKPRPYGDRIHILVSEKLHGRDPTLGWDKLALKGLDIHKLPGDHLAYIREHVETTARQLRECLDQALADD